MNTIVIHIPAQASAATPQSLLTQTCAYTLLGKRDVIERDGDATLTELGALITQTKRVILLLAAVDVTLLRMAVPPLSSAKLRAALPNLIEDRLLEDVSACVVTCSAGQGGMQSIAVVRRAWLALLLQTLRGLGAQRISAVPGQLSLPLPAGRVSAALYKTDRNLSLSLRLSEHEGLGILLQSADELLPTLRKLVPDTPITLFVAPSVQADRQAALASATDIEVQALNGMRLQLPDLSLDLASGVSALAQPSWNWRPWRWPLLLGGLLLVVQTCALNLGWWHLSREANNLRASMNQIYLAAYPKESVILDPLLQMKQKIAASRHEAGLSAPDDFTSLLGEFGQAWAILQPAASIAKIEYHDHKLSIHLKTATSVDAMREALSERKLTLEVSPESELTWQIGSRK